MASAPPGPETIILAGVSSSVHEPCACRHSPLAPEASLTPSRMHIVIVGNGIAGVTAARVVRRRHADWRITLVSDEAPTHYARTARMYVYMGHLTLAQTRPYADRFWRENRIEHVHDRALGARRQRQDAPAARRRASGVGPAPRRQRLASPPSSTGRARISRASRGSTTCRTSKRWSATPAARTGRRRGRRADRRRDGGDAEDARDGGDVPRARGSLPRARAARARVAARGGRDPPPRRGPAARTRSLWRSGATAASRRSETAWARRFRRSGSASRRA